MSSCATSSAAGAPLDQPAPAAVATRGEIAAEWNDPIEIDAVHRHAVALVDTLVDEGPATKDELCKWLGWSEGRFTSALYYARNQYLPGLDLTIPTPTPPRWRYRVTDDWTHVQAGAAFSLGNVESRLRSIHRDVRIVLPNIDRDIDTLAWRRANFLNKHLDHLLRTLGEINGSR